MVSAALQSLIDQGLFERIPATFATYFLEQFKDWALLFPAEQNYFERLFSLINRTPSNEFDTLRTVEGKMGINEKNWPRRSFTLDQVDFLNRNPHYPEWRSGVAAIFAKLDPVLDQEIQSKGRPRLSIVLSPPELPVGPDRLWTRLRGRRVPLAEPLDLAPLVALLHAKEPRPYDRWLIQTGQDIESGPAVAMSYDALEPYRQRLQREVQQVVEKEQIRGPRELGVRLKQMKLLPGEGHVDPLLAEFVRSILLAGNGTLLVNNTFVEWAAVQAIRRARPSLVFTAFGIRNKMKPFSSLLIYDDPDKSNPIPSQGDMLGTYVDLELLYLYVWQEFEKYAQYVRNTVHLFAAPGIEEILVIAPPDFILNKPDSKALAGACREWLQWA